MGEGHPGPTLSESDRASEPLGRREFIWLALLVLGVFVYHYLQARGRVTPWIFPDELRYTEAARAVAETGLPRVRGSVQALGGLQSYLLAPAWLIDDVAVAARAAQAISVAAFSLSALPAFFLARRLVSWHWALVVAAATTLVPAAFYASTAMQEAIAYPIAITTALLLVRVLEWFSWPRCAALAVVLAAAAAARPQLVVLSCAAGVAFLMYGSVSLLGRHRVDARILRVGLLVLPLSLVALAVSRTSAVAGGIDAVLSHPWQSFASGGHAFGAVAVATGIVPAAAAVAAVAHLRDRASGMRVLACVIASFFATFLAYAAVKAATSGFPDLTLVEERNVIYLEPLSFLALLVVLQRTSWRALATGGTAAAVAVATLPFERVANSAILSENPGLSWIWQVIGSPAGSEWLGSVLALASLALAGALLRGPTPTAVLLAVAAWTATAGVLAYRGDHDFSRGFAGAYLGSDPSWVDRAAGSRRVAAVVAREDLDLNGIWSLAYWNRAIRDYVDIGSGGLSLVGRASGISTNGDIDMGSASAVLHHMGEMMPGRILGSSPRDPGLRLTDPLNPEVIPARVEGWFRDGWMGDALLVTRYRIGPAGRVEVDVSATGGLTQRPRVVTASVPVNVQGSVTERPAGRWVLRDGEAATLWVLVDTKPVTVVFRVSPAVSPASVGASLDSRRLGLRVGAVRVPGVPMPE